MKHEQTASQNKKNINIIHSLRPAYYDDFQCLAQDCKFTCCAGWKITMNRKDYLKVHDQHGSELLNQQLKQALRKIKKTPTENMYAELRCNANGFCPMLTEDHLCRLQMECGYQALPDVCQSFPRNKNYSSSGFMEQSLSIACEAVLELLWNLPEGIDFSVEELPKQDCRNGELSMDSPNLYFHEIRSLCIDILQDRRFPIAQRIFLMGFFFQKFPTETQNIPKWYTETQAILTQPNIVEIAASFINEKEDFSATFLLQNIKTMMSYDMSISDKALNDYRAKLLTDFLLKIQKTNTPSNSSDDVHTEHKKELTDTPDSQNTFYNISTNIVLYHQSKENFHHIFGDMEYFFENLAVAIFFDRRLPNLDTKEALWKNYVNFCNVYSLLRFIAITSCREIVPNQKDLLFEGILFIARGLLHSPDTQTSLNDLFFHNESSSLAHMAVLLSQ